MSKEDWKEDWDDAVIVALGSNLSCSFGSCAALIEEALDGFSKFAGIVKAKSSLWRSKSWPDPGYPDYLNAVVFIETSLPPRPLLAALHHIELRFGRQRSTTNAARTLDLDLIAYGRLVLADRDLQLPHPRAADRLFVMGPLAEVAPGWIHPLKGERADNLAKTALVGRDATPLN